MLRPWSDPRLVANRKARWGDALTRHWRWIALFALGALLIGLLWFV